MRKIKSVLICFLSAAMLFGCQENEPNLEALVVPTNLTVSTDISDDGSGTVVFTATSDNAISFKYIFSDGTSEVAPSGKVTKRFTKTGLNTYQVSVVALGTGGISTSKTIEIEVRSDFNDDEAIQLLSGGSTKKWYLAASEPGHLGVGGTFNDFPDQYWFAGFYNAAPFEKCNDPNASCFCDDELTFTLNANGTLTYQQDNKGTTFFNGAHSAVGGGSGSGDDVCLDFNTSGTSTVNLSPATSNLPEGESRGTVINLSNNAFMMYYVGSSSYEILSITDSTLYVRVLDALNPVLAWYLKFSTTPVGQEEEPTGSDFNTLVWEDDFNTAGVPNPANWTYDLGAGGWGNGEAQTYTNNASNVIVEDGVLKITARKEGSGYTSARLKSENLQEFTYGRFEIRAKLPSTAGTWPAIWTLGANFDTVGWPTCGEMDIMEQTGWDKNTVLSTLHYPGNSAGNGPTGSRPLNTSTSEFHNYTIDWSADVIKFYVDDKPVHTEFINSSTTPFNSDFFFIMNVAMGGTLGGTIDPNFTQDTMEVDYIKVYQ
ncbi:family 16 glycosylhydrolase [Sediminicola sp. 1XM1-17]